MGKRKSDKHDSSSSKKSKKQKKHKKKREKSIVSDQEDIDVVSHEYTPDEGKSLKLKIKFGGQTISTTDVVSDSTVEEIVDVESEEIEIEEEVEEVFEEDSEDTKTPARGEEEEEKWLTALDKGELDENGDIKKKKNKLLMTARQRALHGETSDYGMETLQQLPMYPEKSVEEEEEIERKRKLRAKKRRQQMEKQIEETKAQTVEKLLKGSKTKKDTSSRQSMKDIGEHVRYISNQNGFVLAYSEGMECPIEFKTQERISPVKPRLCSVDGCSNIKKYACSKTNRPVCSLQCYKIVNMAAG